MRERVWRDLRRQSGWFPWVMLASAGCTFASLLLSGPGNRLGGPVLYFVVLCGSGALLVLAIVLLVVRRRSGTSEG